MTAATRHYLEMGLAMVLGMVVLGIPAVAALGALGTSMSELSDHAPALLLLGMAMTMSVPMVAVRSRRTGGLAPLLRTPIRSNSQHERWLPCAAT
jgi:hypothetical protein